MIEATYEWLDVCPTISLFVDGRLVSSGPTVYISQLCSVMSHWLENQHAGSSFTPKTETLKTWATLIWLLNIYRNITDWELKYYYLSPTLSTWKWKPLYKKLL